MQQPMASRLPYASADDSDTSGHAPYRSLSDDGDAAIDEVIGEGHDDDGVIYLDDPASIPEARHASVIGGEAPDTGRDSEIRELVAKAIDHTEAALIDVSLAGLRPELIQTYLGLVAELHAMRDGREVSTFARNMTDRRVSRARVDLPTSEAQASYAFTPRQTAVFELLRTGASTRKIAAALNMAEGTVKMHLAAIYRTMRVHSRAEAIAKVR